MSMNKTCPISNFRSDPGSVGIKNVCLFSTIRIFTFDSETKFARWVEVSALLRLPIGLKRAYDEAETHCTRGPLTPPQQSFGPPGRRFEFDKRDKLSPLR